MNKLTLEAIITLHEQRINPRKEDFIEFLEDDWPELYEFMFEIKAVFGSCSMPKLRRLDDSKNVIVNLNGGSK